MKKKQDEEGESINENGKPLNENTSVNTDDENQTANDPEEEIVSEKDLLEKLQTEVKEYNDKFLRLYSEFENYKKRIQKERIDLIKSAGVDVILSLLPVLDDLERALKSMDKVNDIPAIKEGISLIYNKFKNILQQKGLEEMKSIGEIFNTDLHDAITNIPAPSEEMKGKVVEEIEKGYFLNGKVIRHAKIIVGQ